jgi:hypothetical protein
MTTHCKSPGIFCDVKTPHIHPKIARVLLAHLDSISRRDGLDMRTILTRIARVTARNWRDTGRYFLGRNGHAVSVDEETDRIINTRTPRFQPQAMEIPILENIVAFKVVDSCNNGKKLEDALRLLESSSSPLL